MMKGVRTSHTCFEIHFSLGVYKERPDENDALLGNSGTEDDTRRMNYFTKNIDGNPI